MRNTPTVILIACTTLLLACEGNAPQTCRPDCRAGYTCVGGQCVSACNPLCGAGYVCTPELTCVLEGGDVEEDVGADIGDIETDSGADTDTPDTTDTTRDTSVETNDDTTEPDHVVQPAACVDPDDLDFGMVSIGSNATLRLMVFNCGGGTLVLRDLSIEPSVFELDDVLLPVELGPNESFGLTVTFAPVVEGSYEGTLRIVTSDSTRPVTEIQLSGQGVDAMCPHAVLIAWPYREDSAAVRTEDEGALLEAEVDTRIILNAVESYDLEDRVTDYQWTLREKPENSLTTMPQGPYVRNEIRLDVLGDYVVDLTVRNSRGVLSCNVATVTITAQEASDDDLGLRITLTWHTPADDDETDQCIGCGSDLDLHYLHQMAHGAWNVRPWDCYWMNKSPNWGDMSRSDDDPFVDIDDTDGAGPEQIRHPLPEVDHEYQVGVYHYDDHGFGVSYATVRVYSYGELMAEFVDKPLQNSHDFWWVCAITWGVDGVAVVGEVDRVYMGFP